MLIGVGLFVGERISSASGDATILARPHEVQTALQHIGAAIDVLDDSVQDYIIAGAEGAVVVARREDVVRDVPQSREALVEAHDLAVQVDDQDTVGSRLERR